MEKSFSESYKNAGVDVTAGYKSVELMKKSIQSTYNEGVIGDIGGFGGLFAPNLSGMKEPIFVSGTDGVGTKLKLAFLMNKHDTIGQDCVAMCVNDIVCCGAKPLFFLDYMSLWKNIPEMVASIVSGVANGCRQAGCALIGGETAEMPGMYAENEYDLAGFAVGMVDKEKMINSENIEIGDKVIGLASSGVHSNGFSLIRKLFRIGTDENALNQYEEELGMSLGECLLTPTKIYVKPALELISKVNVKGISHITGGGFYENIPRMLRDGVTAVIKKDSYPIPPIFKMLSVDGNIEEKMMYNTYNMGIGMMLAVAAEDADKTVELIAKSGQKGFIVGEITDGEKGVTLV